MEKLNKEVFKSGNKLFLIEARDKKIDDILK